MKDYSVTSGEEYDFILRYKIKEKDKIIIEYASGRIYETNYTPELEKDVLNKMKNQVLNATKFKKYKKARLRMNFFIMIAFTGLVIVLMKYISILSGITIVATGVVVGICKTLMDMPLKKALKDYEKNLLYVKNMDLFQNGISKDMGMYLDLDKESKKTIEMLAEKTSTKNDDIKKSTIEEDSILKEPTINTIDSISPKVVEDLYDLLSRNKEFSKYYNDTNVKKKTLTKQ